MARQRVSTTVDAELLAAARQASPGSDATMLDAALRALLASHRSAELDGAYLACDGHPLDEADEWGDLESFHRAVSQS